MIWEAGRDDGVYFSDAPNSVSSSELKVFRQNRELYHRRYVVKDLPPEPRKAALDIGTGVHEQALLPGCGTRIVEIPLDVLTSNGQRRGKAWEQFEADNKGKVLLKPSDMKVVNECTAALTGNPDVCAFLRMAQFETPIKVECDQTSLVLRSRLDVITKDGIGRPMIIDLKTTAFDVGDTRKMVGVMETHGYVRQLAFYQRVHNLAFGEQAGALMVFVEKSPPFRSRIIEPEPEWLAEANSDNIADLLAIAECFASDEWVTPGIKDIVRVARPRWAAFQTEYDFTTGE